MKTIKDEAHDRLFGQRAGVPRLPIAVHLAPNPADDVLTHRAAKQGSERAANPLRGPVPRPCRRHRGQSTPVRPPASHSIDSALQQAARS